MFLGQMVVAGLVSGAIYALMAVGLVVIYKASGVLNFGHGVFIALGAFMATTEPGDAIIVPPPAIGGVMIFETKRSTPFALS